MTSPPPSHDQRRRVLEQHAIASRGDARRDVCADADHYTDGMLDHFYLGTGPLSTLVPAGTSFTLTLTPSSGSPVSYTLRSNTFTTEPIFIAGVGLASHALSAVTFGQPMTFSWTLPSTFPVAELYWTPRCIPAMDKNLARSSAIAPTPLFWPTRPPRARSRSHPRATGLPVWRHTHISAKGPNGDALCVFLFQ